MWGFSAALYKISVRDMSNPSVNAQDQQKLVEFLLLKYQNLLLELGVLLDIEEVPLEVVEKAARDVMASYLQPPRTESEEEHLRELKGLLLEFEDWQFCDIRDRQHMLISRFRNLLFHLGCNDKTCKEVSLSYLQNELENLEARGHSLRFVSNLKCILRDLKAWRMLCEGPLSEEMHEVTFWRKMSFAPPSTSDEESVSEGPTLCRDAPHCDDFDEHYPLGHGIAKKRKKAITEERRMEYKFLFAAEAHCLRCLNYYAAQPDFDVNCQSCGKNARGWADSNTTENIPTDIDAWLRDRNL